MRRLEILCFLMLSAMGIAGAWGQSGPVGRYKESVDGVWLYIVHSDLVNESKDSCRIKPNGNREILGGTLEVPQTITVEEGGTTRRLFVAEIAEAAFKGRKDLRVVTIPYGVRRIHKEAFAECENLEEVNLPAGLKLIGEKAFYGAALKELSLPGRIGANNPNNKVGYIADSILDYAFAECKKLKTVYWLIGDIKVGNSPDTEKTVFSGIPKDATLYIDTWMSTEMSSYTWWNREAGVTGKLEKVYTNVVFCDGATRLYGYNIINGSEAVKRLTPDPVKVGHRFLGWKQKVNGNVLSDYFNFNVAASTVKQKYNSRGQIGIELQAQWEKRTENKVNFTVKEGKKGVEGVLLMLRDEFGQMYYAKSKKDGKAVMPDVPVVNDGYVVAKTFEKGKEREVVVPVTVDAKGKANPEVIDFEDFHSVTFTVVEKGNASGKGIDKAIAKIGTLTFETANGGKVSFELKKNCDYPKASFSAAGYSTKRVSVSVDGSWHAKPSTIELERVHDVKVKVKNEGKAVKGAEVTIVDDAGVKHVGRGGDAAGDGEVVVPGVPKVDNGYVTVAAEIGGMRKTVIVPVKVNEKGEASPSEIDFNEVFDVKLVVVEKGGSAKPIEKATVTVGGGMLGVTNTKGEVVLGLKKGVTYSKVEASATGYSTTTVSVVVDGSGKANPEKIALDPLRKVQFEVKDKKGSPVEGATVTFIDQPKKTGANGVAEFDRVMQGVYTFVVTKDGYETQSGAVRVEKDEKVQVTLEKRDPNSSEMGVVFVVKEEGSGALLEGAEVRVNGKTLNTSSTPMGEANVKLLKGHGYSYAASKAGYGSAMGKFEVSVEGQRVEVLLKRLAGTPSAATDPKQVTFIVKEKGSGAVLQGVTVTMNGRGEKSDAQGKVTFDGVAKGTHSYSAHLDKYEDITGQAVVEDKDREVEIFLTPKKGTPSAAKDPKRVTFIVKEMGSGALLKGAKVTMNGKISVSDADGKAIFEGVEKGTHAYAARLAKYEDCTGKTVTVDGDKEVEIFLTPGSGTPSEPKDGLLLSFTVKEKGSGAVLKGAMVTLDRTEVETDAQGNAVFEGVKKGNHSYSVQLDKYEDCSGKTVEVAEDMEVEVFLAPKAGTPTAAQNPKCVTFIVKEIGSGAILSEATVTMNGKDVKSDTQGKAVFEQVEKGTHSYTARLDKYEDCSGKTVTVEEDMQVEIFLTPKDATHTAAKNPKQVTFIVKDATSGAVLKGAKVTMNGKEVESDAKGKAVFEGVETGSHSYEARLDKYEDCTGKTVEVTEDKEEEILLTPGTGTPSVPKHAMRVTFIVKEMGSGALLPGAKVTMNGKEVESDDQGKAVFEGVVKGTHGYTARLDNYEDCSGKAVTVAEDIEVEIILTPASGASSAAKDTKKVTFVVREFGSGAVLSGATVIMNGKEVKSDAQGKAVFDGVAKGTQSYKAQLENYKDASGKIEVMDIDKEVDIFLTPKDGTPSAAKNPKQVTFIVKDAQSEEVLQGAKVTMNGKVVVSDEQGKAVFERVEKGTHGYEATRDNYVDFWGEVLIVEADMEKTIFLRKATSWSGPAHISLYTVESGSLEPIVKVKVKLEQGDELGSSNDRGVLHLSMKPGSYTLVLSHDDYEEEKITLSFDDRGVDFTAPMRRKTGDASTAVESVTLSAVQILSNPVENSMVLEGMASAERVEVYSMTGVLLRSERLHGEPRVAIAVEGLASGVYVVRVIAHDGERMLRCVKR